MKIIHLKVTTLAVMLVSALLGAAWSSVAD